MNEVIEDFNDGKVSSVYVRAPFGIGKAELESQGYRIISLEENARLRMQSEYGSNILTRGNIVREAVVFIPGVLEGFLTKTSTFIENPPELIKGRIISKYPLTDEELDQTLTNSVKFSDNPIHTDRFDEDPLTSFIFGKESNAYGKFLKERGINEIIPPLRGILSHKRKPFARYLFIEGVNYYVGIDEWRGGKENLKSGEKSDIIGSVDSPSTVPHKMFQPLRGIKELK